MNSGSVLRHANDNLAIGAEFVGLPEGFLLAYQSELMAWAGDLQGRGPGLELNLWNPPGATVLSSGWQGTVRLRCEVRIHPVTKFVKMVISPDGEEEAARVRRHVEDLPGIMAAHRAGAAAARDKPRGYISAVFEGIPDYFVERYAEELGLWGKNLGKIGLEKHIVLNEGALSDLSPDEEMGAVLIRVTLKAKVERLAQDRLRLVISPCDERDERMIALHCEKMQRAGIPASVALVEPERPGMPFMPTIRP